MVKLTQTVTKNPLLHLPMVQVPGVQVPGVWAQAVAFTAPKGTRSVFLTGMTYFPNFSVLPADQKTAVHAGGRGNGSRGPSKRKGLDISYKVSIGFEEAINGASRRLSLNDGRHG